ncbi:hypothetical protein FHT91_004157 [Rhizobium sp. BK347]|nr:hypothetical protein [Rhizobium sp. BK252]MBB3403902.1 hypothetical protein [Rhizobium sp. BK289]MBB3416429.1 hypothetical protein [Rhizobium sp. BK284]MBB3484365.1 hypothetical protein [Rhizobium sp. BK347]
MQSSLSIKFLGLFEATASGNFAIAILFVIVAILLTAEITKHIGE